MKRIFYITILMSLIGLASMTNAFALAPIDTVTIYQLQHVADPAVDDSSPLLGDTIVVRGLVMHYPRDLWVAARWATYIVDPDSFPKPWSGFFIIQDDTLGEGINTLFSFVEPGMICYFTGVVSEYSGFSQINTYSSSFKPDPLIPITIESTGHAIPDPVKLSTADLQTNTSGEQWESMWVQVENATIINNAVSSNRASIADNSGGLTYLDDYFLWYRKQFDNNPNFDWPPAGTLINAKGFIRHTAKDEYGINPRTGDDVQTLTNPPLVKNVTRIPGVPTTRGDVIVKANITDNTIVAEALIHYSVNWGDFQQVTMTNTALDTFSAKIPQQADGAYVRYFIYARDDAGDNTTLPGDTSLSIYYYVVRKSGLSIKDLQYTWGYKDDASGFRGYNVTVKGIVTTDSSHFSNSYYIQDKEEAWSGIWVRDYYHFGFAIGDMVEVTGTVQEDYGVTRIANVDSATGAKLLSSGNVINPIVVTTGEITTGGANAEAYESVLVKVQNLTVSNAYPDAPSNFGEFSINDGSGALRVDDLALYFDGNLNNAFALNDHIDAMIAIHYFSFSNYKLLPRSNADIIGHNTDIEDSDAAFVKDFSLNQNYPNPFNPSTVITYAVPKAGDYTLTIYNLLGQKVRTLATGAHSIGQHQAQWDGMDKNGARVSSGIYFYTLSGQGVKMSRKMVLVR